MRTTIETEPSTDSLPPTSQPLQPPVSDAPLPLEQTDPDLAEHLRLIANRQHPAVRTLVIESERILTDGLDGRVRTKHIHMPGRNDPCHCGSGKKFKKCCLR